MNYLASQSSLQEFFILQQRMQSDLPLQQSNGPIESHLQDLALAVEEISESIILLDKDGVITWVNKSFVKVHQQDVQQVTGTLLTDFLQHNQASKIKVDEIELALKSGKDYTGTVFMINTKKRLPQWNEIKIKPFKDEQGNLLRYVLVSRDITEHIKKNEELLYSELRWKFALEESGDGFFEYDLVNHKFLASDNLLSLIALTTNSTKLDFTALINIIHPLDSEAAVNALFDLISGKITMLRNELRIKNKAGDYVWIIVRATISSKTADGKASGLIGTTTDISYIKETELQLVKAKTEAELASEYKNQFLSTMSHEIRTPLNAIIGITDFMLMKKPTGELKENLSILSFSANHLLSLINDVLDLSKIESGKMEFVSAEFNLEETINIIYQTFQSKCRETGIELSYEVETAIPEYIIGDSLRLTQIMNNLVNNAIKFTLKGSVRILVKLIDANSDKVKLLFEVIDTGIGIDEHRQQLIFEDFVQANASIAQQYGGTGLGLAITKKLIALQGGTIKVESVPRIGSRFYFELEFGFNKASTTKGQKNENRKPESNNIQGVKVLLVEDILANQKVAVSYLTHWQGEVKCAVNGQEALKLFAEHNFDMLLVDLYMPVMNGFETIEAIRKLPKGKKVPIIALTASVEPSVIEKAIASGADVCMGKPLEAKRLLEEIQKLTGKKQNRNSDNPDAEKNATQQNGFAHINLKRIEDASLGSEAFVGEMIKLLKQEIPACIQACTAELEKKDYTGFSEQIHKLKNSLFMLGLDVIKPELVTLEENARSGKQLDELKSLFEKILDKWALASKELNQL